MPRDGGPDPLPHQVASNGQPCLALECEAYRGDARHGGTQPLPAEQQRDRTTTNQQLSQSVEAGNEPVDAGLIRTLPQVEGHRVHQAAAGEPAGQLDRLEDRRGRDDEQPFQLDSQPLGGGRIQAAGGVDPGDDPTRLLGCCQ